MTILQSLESYYHRLPGVAQPGWSPEKFGWCIVLNRYGQPVDVEDLRDLTGKKPAPKLYIVPASFPRPGVTPRAFFLWDKTAFLLGVTKGQGEQNWQRADNQHAAFRELHLNRLAGQDDEGLVALRRFIENWTPDRFDAPPFKAEMLDVNVMFRLDGELQYLHERPAARDLAAPAVQGGKDGEEVFCLVSGERGPPARLHPTIKGVEGAQTSGAALVSFNLDAFESYGQEQGDNAPTSQGAAFRYGAALNHLLTRDGPNRLRRPVGDATVVFWADTSDANAAKAADDLFAHLLDSDATDENQAAQISKVLKGVAAGEPLAKLRPDIDPGTRFHILGLSPNAARLSVRFWLTDTLDAFVHRLARHHEDLTVDPPPHGWGAGPSVNRLLVNTVALQGDFKNIPHLLAGEVMRAVLSGGRYPQSLLAAVLIRLRAGDPKMQDGRSGSIGWHAAVIRAVLHRDQRLSRGNPENPGKGETPMSLKRDHPNPGYQLGRLFAVCEMAQKAALGTVNATIRDRYYGAASATPASVFPMIVRNAQNHFAKARKIKPGWANLIEKELIEINDRFEPRHGGTWPRSLRLQDQGEFAIGYYHQRATKLTNDKGEAFHADDLPETTDSEGTE